MAAFRKVEVCKLLSPLSIPSVALRGIQTSSVLWKKHIRAGRYKSTRTRDNPLTYEEAKAPYLLGVDKAWHSWNSSAISLASKEQWQKNNKRGSSVNGVSTIEFAATLQFRECSDTAKQAITLRGLKNLQKGNLLGEGRKSEILVEDAFIRQFMAGTWHKCLASEMIIKRRHNMIVLAGLMLMEENMSKISFLIGYTEELLSCLLKCPVKLELQSIAHKDDLIFKYV